MTKLLNLHYLFIILLSSLMLTSCLDSSEPQGVQYMEVVTVKRNAETLYFENDFGVTFYATQNQITLDFSNVKRAVIIFTLPGNGYLTAEQKKYQVVLEGVFTIDGQTFYTSKHTPGDSLKQKYNDPILGFDRMVLEGDSVMLLNRTLTVKINYYFGEPTHDFGIFRYSEDRIRASDKNADTIDLYWGHNAHGDKGKYLMNQWSTTYPQCYYKSFDINTLIPELNRGEYYKDTIVMRIHYRMDRSNILTFKDTVDAMKFVKYPINN